MRDAGVIADIDTRSRDPAAEFVEIVDAMRAFQFFFWSRKPLNPAT
jgi:hypothetical protein